MLHCRFVVAAFFLTTCSASAHTLADWADTTTEIATDAPNTVRTMALSQSAVYEALNAITRRYPRDLVDLGDTKGASLDAAIAAASMTVLRHEAPNQMRLVDDAYDKALRALPDDAARAHGVDVGVRAANDVLSKHTDDLGNPDPYRPITQPGVYVVTTFPLGVAVSQHKPWFLKSPSEFRPGPPPLLTSDVWARDYKETMSYGAIDSTLRTPEQTLIARFWATALPDVHIGVVHALATDQKREITRSARLYAAVTAAMNDTEIAVFDAKYYYNFWRPITSELATFIEELRLLAQKLAEQPFMGASEQNWDRTCVIHTSASPNPHFEPKCQSSRKVPHTGAARIEVMTVFLNLLESSRC